jgi:hypothetical protein
VVFHEATVLGAKPIGSANSTEAVNTGSVIDDSVIVAGTSGKITNTGEPLAGGLQIKLNYDGKNYNGELLVMPQTFSSVSAYNAETRKTESKMWRCNGLKSADKNVELQQKLLAHFADRILARLIKPRAEISYNVSIEALLKFAVGSNVLINDSYLRNPYTGALGVSSMGGIVYSSAIDLVT